MTPRYALTWWLYGLIVLGSGCFRYFTKPAGEKALYFGFVMGGLALLAAFLIRAGRIRVGHIVGLTAIAFVAGWFLFESLVKDGGSYEPRLLLVAAISLAQGFHAIRNLARVRGER